MQYLLSLGLVYWDFLIRDPSCIWGKQGDVDKQGKTVNYLLMPVPDEYEVSFFFFFFLCRERARKRLKKSPLKRTFKKHLLGSFIFGGHHVLTLLYIIYFYHHEIHPCHEQSLGCVLPYWQQFLYTKHSSLVQGTLAKRQPLELCEYHSYSKLLSVGHVHTHPSLRVCFHLYLSLLTNIH